MDNHHFSEADLEDILHACRDRLEIPAMADAVPAALNRIRQTPTHSQRADQVIAAAQPSLDPAGETEEPAQQTGSGASTASQTLDPPRSRSRELVGIAGAALAIALIGGILVILFQDRSNDQEPAAGTENPLVSDPYEIEGYEFVQAIGAPIVPNQPADVVVAPDGTTFVADRGSHRIVAFDSDGNLATGWGENGVSERIDNPTRLALDSDGSLYVLESNVERIQKLDTEGKPTDSWRLPEAGDGRYRRATGLAIGTEGNIHIVVQVSLRSGMSSSISGSGPPDSLIETYDPAGNRLSRRSIDVASPTDLALDTEGRVYISHFPPVGLQAFESGVNVYDPDGRLLAEWSLSDITTHENHAGITSLSVDSTGNVHIVASPAIPSSGTAAGISLVQLSPTGNRITSHEIDVGITQITGGQYPSIATAPDGGVLVPDPARQRIAVVNADGKTVREIKEDTEGRFAELIDITADAAGNVYTVDPQLERLLKFDNNGEPVREYSLDDQSAHQARGSFLDSIAVAPDGSVYAGDAQSMTVAKFTQDGELISDWAELQANPRWIAADDTGNVYVGLFDSNRNEAEQQVIRKFAPNGDGLGTPVVVPDDAQMSDFTVGGGILYVATSPIRDSVVRSDQVSITAYDLDGNKLREVARFNHVPEEDDEIKGGPLSLTADRHGNVHVLNFDFVVENNQLVERFLELMTLSPEGEVLNTSVISPDIPVGNAPSFELAVNADRTVYLADLTARQIFVYEPATDEAGHQATETTPTTAAPDSAEPTATKTMPTIEDLTPQSVVPSRPFELDGYEFAGALGGSTVPNKPTDVMVGPDGRTFVADVGASRVLAFNQDGELIEG